MSSGPRVIAIVLVIGASLWSLHITTMPDDPFSTDSAVLVAIGLLMFSLISAVGLLVPRGRWARNLARGLLAFEAVLAVATPLQGWAVAGLVATGLGIVGIQGKWFDGWLRRLPSADGPGLKTMGLILGCLALVPIVGLTSPSGVVFRQGLLGAAGIVIAWGYGKANMWGLWAARLLLVPLAVAAAFAAPPAGAALVVVFGIGLTLLAWSSEARLAISPLMDQLPGPRNLGPLPGATE